MGTFEFATAEEWLVHCVGSTEWKPSDRPIVMISYAREDAGYLAKLRKNLDRALKRVRSGDDGATPFTVWDYARHGSGTELGSHFPSAVAERMWRCRAAVVIFSPEYVASSYCMDVELPFLLWRMVHQGLRVFLLRLNETVADDEILVTPAVLGPPSRVDLRTIVDDRNPALVERTDGNSEKMFKELERLEPDRAEVRLIAYAKAIARILDGDEQVRAEALREAAERKAREAAEVARLEAERVAREAEERRLEAEGAAREEEARREAEREARTGEERRLAAIRAGEAEAKSREEAERVEREAEAKRREEAERLAREGEARRRFEEEEAHRPEAELEARRELERPQVPEPDTVDETEHADGEEAARRARLVRVLEITLPAALIGIAVVGYALSPTAVVGPPKPKVTIASPTGPAEGPTEGAAAPAPTDTSSMTVSTTSMKTTLERGTATSSTTSFKFTDQSLPPGAPLTAMARSVPSFTGPAAPIPSAESAVVAKSDPRRSSGAEKATTEVAPNVARAVLYEEGKDKGVAAITEARTSWNTASDPKFPGSLSLVGRVEIPDRKTVVTLKMDPNRDASFPASHLIEIRFTLPADFDGKSIANVPGLILKASEQARGDPLRAAAAKHSANVFWVALANGDEDRAANTRMLDERGWIDLPILYESGRRAILTLSKPAAGDAAYAAATASWRQTK